MKPVRKVVFPVAGLGTRFLPATKAMPKEMLPVVDKPLIQYAVEEAAAAGVTDMISSRGATREPLKIISTRARNLKKISPAKVRPSFWTWCIPLRPLV